MKLSPNPPSPTPFTANSSNMSGTTLIVGATGNTGQEVVRTLSKLLAGRDHRIIALTRRMDSDVVRNLSEYPGVEFEEVDWTDIDVDWLKSRAIGRAFIAPQNG
jgi:nucleoside-diphosphate-sugar epimerase